MTTLRRALALLVLAGCVTPVEPAAEDVEPCGLAGFVACDVRAWEWSLAGHSQLGMDVTIDFGTANSCNQTIEWQAFSNAPRPIMTTFELRNGEVFAEAAYGGLRTVHSTKLPQIDAPERYPGGIGFEDRALAGLVRTVAAGIDLDADGGPDGTPPMSWQLACAQPFNVTRMARSDDVALWEAGYMGGDGTAVRSLAPYVWYTKQVDGFLRLEGQPNGSVLFLASNYEELQSASGQISLDGPAQDPSWNIDGRLATHFEGPSGAYDLHVDYESVGSPDRLIGILGTFKEPPQRPE